MLKCWASQSPQSKNWICKLFWQWFWQKVVSGGTTILLEEASLSFFLAQSSCDSLSLLLLFHTSSNWNNSVNLEQMGSITFREIFKRTCLLYLKKNWFILYRYVFYLLKEILFLLFSFERKNLFFDLPDGAPDPLHLPHHHAHRLVNRLLCIVMPVVAMVICGHDNMWWQWYDVVSHVKDILITVSSTDFYASWYPLI